MVAQVYFYLPPEDAELPSLVSERTFLGIINAIVVILAFGRLTDSVTDILIANWSDRTVSRWGRRIPFMAVGMLPGAAATALMFVPPFTECAAASGSHGWAIALNCWDSLENR